MTDILERPVSPAPPASPAFPACPVSPALRSEDPPVRVSGVLDLAGGRAHLRTAGLLPSPEDPLVPQDLVRRLDLRRGDLVQATTARPPQGTGRRSGPAARTVARVELVNGHRADALPHRPHFADLTPLHPVRRLRLETAPHRLATRVIDLLAPVGKGQRGLIVAPPKTGKTMILQAVADAVARNHPECHLMVVLLDERPEEVTEMRRSVRGEVLSSTFDRPARDHTALADLAVERAKRLAELGGDVVVLLDSLTRLCRAHNTTAPGNGRTLSGGVDASALLGPKRFFGAARALEEGGSLTILATALVETGSRADDYFFEELKSTGNMELRLDRALADRRIFPAVDPGSSGTRREELLASPAELAATGRLRRLLGAQTAQQGMETVLARMRESAGNADFLQRVLSTTPARP
ncbi:transcription termination factor Rho [Peterkaempfera bronchialis]|uniref:transcription termination factor Rho n=1 Tax=Peterkaempfera bronchialis TaxID=2126346 RepID=UPI0026780879